MSAAEAMEHGTCGLQREFLIRRAMRAEGLLAERGWSVEQARLLAISRMVFDEIAEGRPFTRDQAADLAQRIVDEIGHSITDEPALGPSFREEIVQLRASLARAHAAADSIRRALREVDEYGEHGWYGYVALSDVRDLIAALNPADERPNSGGTA